MDAVHIEDIRKAMAERVERVKQEGGSESPEDLTAWMTVLIQDFTALTARVEELERRPANDRGPDYEVKVGFRSARRVSNLRAIRRGRSGLQPRGFDCSPRLAEAR
jgi:hypothetical protein